MHASLPNSEIDLAALQRGDNAQTVRLWDDIDQARRAGRVRAERPDLAARPLGHALEQIEPGIVGVQDRDSARSHAGENFRLRPRDPDLPVWEVLHMHRTHRGDHRRVRLNHSR